VRIRAKLAYKATVAFSLQEDKDIKNKRTKNRQANKQTNKYFSL